jgi:cell division protein FtsB
MNLWVAIYRLAWGLLGLLLLVLLGYAYYPPVRKFDELRRREAKLDEDIRFEEQREKHLKAKQEKLLNDPRFVEKIAREQLGLAKPGEVIFKVSESALATNVPSRGPR